MARPVKRAALPATLSRGVRQGMANARSMPILGAFIARPRLIWAAGVGLTVWVGLSLATSLPVVTIVTLGWDAMCAAFLALILPLMFGSNDPDGIRANAAT